MPKAKPKVSRESSSTFPYLVVGVDPGKSGGVAWITPQRVITAVHTPEGEEGLNELVASIEENAEDLIGVDAFCFIEMVHSMPQQSSVATFSFGQTFGMARQAFSIFPREFVRPQAWMKGLQIVPRKKTESKLQYKERLRVKARQLFPKLDCWNQSKGFQLAVCDALLIMEYGRRKLLGEFNA